MTSAPITSANYRAEFGKPAPHPNNIHSGEVIERGADVAMFRMFIDSAGEHACHWIGDRLTLRTGNRTKLRYHSLVIVYRQLASEVDHRLDLKRIAATDAMLWNWPTD
jgi:hypothetical protein